MIHIAFAFSFFILSVAAHILYCRQLSSKALHAKVFVGFALAVALMMMCVFSRVTTNGNGLPFTAVVLYFLLIPAYLIFYVSTSLISPSKSILWAIQKGNGASREDLLSAISRENFVVLRLEELIASKCVRHEGDHFVLTVWGKTIVCILDVYQFFLGQKVGG